MDDALRELRSYWEFAAVSQFLHLFHETFGLNEFETEDLESWMLNETEKEKLVELIVKILRVCTLNRFITLYKEEPAKPLRNPKSFTTTEEAAGWELVCLTSNDWRQFPDQFRNSKNLMEKYLYEYLVEYALPGILPEVERKERKRQKEAELAEKEKQRLAAEALRKRSTRLMIKEITRQEDEKKREEEQQRLRKEREMELAELKREEELMRMANRDESMLTLLFVVEVSRLEEITKQ
ncbi:hypothetical protein HDV05_003903 [Chytridiales sp. JEL 0842]|nr:hypothetical protein HDV05_003903 [Chytridiales sp. JEL 0842]